MKRITPLLFIIFNVSLYCNCQTNLTNHSSIKLVNRPEEVPVKVVNAAGQTSVKGQRAVYSRVSVSGHEIPFSLIVISDDAKQTIWAGAELKIYVASEDSFVGFSPVPGGIYCGKLFSVSKNGTTNFEDAWKSVEQRLESDQAISDQTSPLDFKGTLEPNFFLRDPTSSAFGIAKIDSVAIVNRTQISLNLTSPHGDSSAQAVFDTKTLVLQKATVNNAQVLPKVVTNSIYVSKDEKAMQTIFNKVNEQVPELKLCESLVGKTLPPPSWDGLAVGRASFVMRNHHRYHPSTEFPKGQTNVLYLDVKVDIATFESADAARQAVEKSILQRPATFVKSEYGGGLLFKSSSESSIWQRGTYIVEVQALSSAGASITLKVLKVARTEIEFLSR